MAVSHKTLFALLILLRGEISEECMCSGWEGDLEYTLWDAVLDKPLWIRWQQIVPDQRQMLRELSEELGGWAVCGIGDSEPRFVQMSDWEKMYAEKTRQ